MIEIPYNEILDIAVDRLIARIEVEASEKDTLREEDQSV